MRVALKSGLFMPKLVLTFPGDQALKVIEVSAERCAHSHVAVTKQALARA